MSDSPDTRPSEHDRIARRAAELILRDAAVKDESRFREQVLIHLENIDTRLGAIEDTRLPAIENSMREHVKDDNGRFVEVHQTIGDTKSKVTTILAVTGAVLTLATLAAAIAKLFI